MAFSLWPSRNNVGWMAEFEVGLVAMRSSGSYWPTSPLPHLSTMSASDAVDGSSAGIARCHVAVS